MRERLVAWLRSWDSRVWVYNENWPTVRQVTFVRYEGDERVVEERLMESYGPPDPPPRYHFCHKDCVRGYSYYAPHPLDWIIRVGVLVMRVARWPRKKRIAHEIGDAL